MNAASPPPRAGRSALAPIRPFARSRAGESSETDRWCFSRRLRPLGRWRNRVTRHLPHELQYLLLAAVLSSVAAGCAAYRFGAYTMYPGNVRTVHVPVFRSQSIRRDLSEWLTEAVVKEIELKTNYKVVGRDQAESILEGEIIRDQKNVLVETGGDQPRALDVTMLAHVRWTNRHGQQLCPDINLPLPDTLTIVEEPAILVPEVGHSLASSQQRVIHRLAEQIVANLEMAW